MESKCAQSKSKDNLNSNCVNHGGRTINQKVENSDHTSSPDLSADRKTFQLDAAVSVFHQPSLFEAFCFFFNEAPGRGEPSQLGYTTSSFSDTPIVNLQLEKRRNILLSVSIEFSAQYSKSFLRSVFFCKSIQHSPGMSTFHLFLIGDFRKIIRTTHS